jgi:hypothetical protein
MQKRSHQGHDLSQPDNCLCAQQKNSVHQLNAYKGTIGNVDYIYSALRKFLKARYQKRPDVEHREWMFPSDKAPIPTNQESAGVPGQK